MKRIVFSVFFMAVIGNAYAYDFSAVTPTGQTLYYNYVSDGVSVTYPGSSDVNPYAGFGQPTGSLTIPDFVTIYGTTYSVTSIDEYAFCFCSNLTSVTIPNSVTSVGNSAFYGCSGLTSVTIPNSVTSIGISAFYGCSGLTSVIIPNSITNIENNAFYGCSGLTSVIIPNSVTSIGNSAFYGCSGLISVTIPNSVTSIDNWAFKGCNGLTSVTIPNSVTSIGGYAFYTCSGLISVTIGNSVASIGNNAFRDCSSLTSVTFNADSCTSTGGAFDNRAFYGCTNITNFTFGNNVKAIPTYLCYGLSGLTSITIPNSVKSIGVAAFSLCNGLTSATIGDSVTSIGNSAFSGCSGLTSVTFNADSCTSAGGGSAFYNCTNITNFTFGNNVKIIPPYLCSGLTSLTSVIIGNSVISIGNWAFDGCSGLTSVTIPNSVTSIGGYAFRGCSGLTSVTIPDFVTLIGTWAFNGCSSLVSVTIGNSVTSIGNRAFGYCSGLTSVTIPNSVTSIGGYAFYTCSGLTSVTIGNSVTSIGEWAFRDCCSLTEINSLALTAPSLGSAVFTGVSATIPVNIPCGSTASYQSTWTCFSIFNEPPQYTLNVQSNSQIMGSASITTAPCNTFSIEAIANYGYHFVQWNDGDTSNPRTIILTQDSTVTAYFAPNQYSIAGISADTIRGNVIGSTVADYLDTATLTATANYGYHFIHWNDGNTDNPRTITLTQDTIFTAYFAPNQYTITGTSANEVRGSVSGGNTVDYLDSVTLTATANYGYHFDHWSDGSTNNPHTIAVTQNATITAYFEPDLFTISLQSANPSYGYVEVDSIWNFYLSSNTFSAIPNYGYHFTHWNDGVAESTRTITLTQDTTFTASFAPNQYNLTAVSADESMGTVSGGGTYDYGNIITVTANPVEHYHFLHWNDGNTENPRSIEIQGDYTITAFFAIDTHTVSVTVNDISRGMVEASGPEFVYGTPCTVTATAYSGYVFSHWSNNVTYNPYTFAVMEDVELVAIFVEEGTQGISDVGDINGFKVYTKGRIIHINGIEGQCVSVYSVDGRIITTKQNAAEQETILVPSSGVYFIKVGEYPARKVVVVR